MKIEFLQMVFNWTRYALVVMLCMTMTFLTAKGETQKEKSIESIYLSLDLKGEKITEIFSKIEAETPFTFAYRKSIIDDKARLNGSFSDESLASLLRYVSQNTGLSFKRVDEVIQVSISDEKPTVTELSVADQNDVSGKVVDQNGQGLPGVSVIVQGTTSGTTTDGDGIYRLTVPAGATLVYSFVGFETQEVQVGNRSVIDVSMTEDVEALEEVVVTALGIEKDQKTLGYATAKVEPEDFNVNRTPNFMNTLQGKIAGVNITNMGSGPQGSTKVRIRGHSSFGGKNSPLIVVNGVPIDNTNFGVSGESSEVGSNRKSDSGDGLSSINPDDVTSMTVLKGAAASALYGARAKDGVIMITTRNRAAGSGISVTYNMNYTNGTPLDLTDYQYEYGQGEGGVRPNAPGPTSGVWSFGEPMGGTQILFDGVTAPYEPTPGKIRHYYNNSQTLMNSVTVASGGENGGFSLSLSNMDANAVLPGSDYNRKTINLGFTQKIKKLTVSGNMNYSYEYRKNPPNIAEQDFSPVVIYTLSSSMPMDLLEQYASDENGDEISYSRFTNRTNPYFALKRFENNYKDRIFGNVTAKYNLTDWLFIQGRVGQDFFSRDVDYNLPTGSQRQSAPPPGFVNGQYVQDQRRYREVNSDFLIGFAKDIGKIGININAGGNTMYRRSDIFTILGENFFTRDLYTIGNASKQTPNYSLSERKVNSLYGSAEVSYNEWIYLQGTVRNDWFSTLSPENRSILYPSITTSFVFSEALADVLPDWITFGKLRVAYAEVGSDTDVSPYSNNLFYSISTQQLLNQPVGNINAGTIPNPNLKPMRVQENEFGIELTLFDNIDFQASYYNKLSSDQILSAQISNASGFGNQLINVGESRNKGLELMAAFYPVRNSSFSWNFIANGAYNESEVLSLGDDVDGTFITVGTAEFHGEVRQVVGRPMAQLYGWGYLRDDQNRIVYDPNSGRPLRSSEQLNFGSAIPAWVGGFTNSFDFKGITASFLIDFKLGHKLISGTHTNAYRHGLDKATLPGRDVGFIVGDGVNPDGSINETQAAIQPFYETIRSFRMSEQSVFKAGSWQLRQITVGYDFTRFVVNTNVIKGLKLNLVANNVAVLKQWVPHVHPDQNGIIDDNMIGLESTGLPITRDIGFNLNVKF
ncbi:MAG: SusC/RagA family TonB-linked outer membrane protein [Cyclobacteriaceae bacterium]